MIELSKVTVIAGDFVLKDISFSVAPGQYSVLMGRTGRGKTTLLEAICGLRRVTKGRIVLRSEDVTELSPADREVGYVPQDLALFPNLSVAEHIQFALQLRHQPKPEISKRTSEIADELGITHLLDRGIKGLSGGESQRVALGRALSFRPSILLLDEPLSALDQSTRHEMYELLRRVTRTYNITTLHITHSEEEASAMADVRFELSDGKVQKVTAS